ncbi:MAG: cadherin-like domain-containing protein, partial [Candidatus Bipolaricaulota bacterium]
MTSGGARNGQRRRIGVTLLAVGVLLGVFAWTGFGAPSEYAIDSWTVVSNGLYVTISGTGHGSNTVGNPGQHNVEMDWGDGIVLTCDAQLDPITDEPLSGTFTYPIGDPDPTGTVTWTWTALGGNKYNYTVSFSFEHTYNPVNVLGEGYIAHGHSQSVGQESDLASITLAVDFIEVLQSGLPADSDGTFTIVSDDPNSVIAPGPVGGAYYYNVQFAILTEVPGTTPSYPNITVDGEDTPSVGSILYTLDHWERSWLAGSWADPMTFTLQAGSESVTAFYLTENRPPVAADDSYITCHDTVLTVSAPGVLGNDTDPDGDPLQAINASTPSYGSLTLNTDGSFVYTPNTSHSGADSFTYDASDGSLTDQATVTITTTAAINPSIAVTVDQCTGYVTLTASADHAVDFAYSGLPAGMTDHGDGTATGTVAAGTYTGITVTATDLFYPYCEETATTGFTVNNLLIVTLTLESTDHCNGIVYFSALAEGGDGSYTYLWPDGSGGT